MSEQNAQTPHQPQYQPYAAAPAAPPRTNTLAIIALVAAFVAPIVGFVLGFVAMSQTRKRGEGGRGLALAAVIVGGVITLLYVVLVIGLVAVAASAPTVEYPTGY
ncbi:DUF4190 domain-containing protein [Curtobacterium citreum]|uniref:DUF4190 domain-containing protein n=1 Tax=Curtobacterium citreum TaxID=2036 RepID=UPI00254ECC93|nr:DUF4190 domain-containing protein [Curtobacterium citreum]MDK8173604.1 DUF4190 domain-containing protein [Curtobacterium citreum]